LPLQLKYDFHGSIAAGIHKTSYKKLELRFGTAKPSMNMANLK
jgi:hypothetical protein